MSKVIVHVNQHIIKHNAKHGDDLPTLTVKLPAPSRRPEGLQAAPDTIYCHEVTGRGSVVDINARGRDPLSCGARVWMEFDSEDFEIVGSWCGFDILEVLRKRMAACAA